MINSGWSLACLLQLVYQLLNPFWIQFETQEILGESIFATW